MQIKDCLILLMGQLSAVSRGNLGKNIEKNRFPVYLTFERSKNEEDQFRLDDDSSVILRHEKLFRLKVLLW